MPLSRAQTLAMDDGALRDALAAQGVAAPAVTAKVASGLQASFADSIEALFPVSLLLALLRKKLAEFDASGGDTRLVLSRDEVAELMRVFLPAGSNEVKLIDQIEYGSGAVARRYNRRRSRRRCS